MHLNLQLYPLVAQTTDLSLRKVLKTYNRQLSIHDSRYSVINSKFMKIMSKHLFIWFVQAGCKFIYNYC